MDNSRLLFNEAKEKLINAKIALENERYNLCVSESFMLCFMELNHYYQISISLLKNIGAMSEFSKHYLKTKLFNMEIGKYYFEFEKNRNKADMTYW